MIVEIVMILTALHRVELQLARVSCRTCYHSRMTRLSPRGIVARPFLGYDLYLVW